MDPRRSFLRADSCACRLAMTDFDLAFGFSVGLLPLSDAVDVKYSALSATASRQAPTYIIPARPVSAAMMAATSAAPEAVAASPKGIMATAVVILRAFMGLEAATADRPQIAGVELAAATAQFRQWHGLSAGELAAIISAAAAVIVRAGLCAPPDPHASRCAARSMALMEVAPLDRAGVVMASTPPRGTWSLPSVISPAAMDPVLPSPMPVAVVNRTPEPDIVVEHWAVPDRHIVEIIRAAILVTISLRQTFGRHGLAEIVICRIAFIVRRIRRPIAVVGVRGRSVAISSFLGAGGRCRNCKGTQRNCRRR